MRKKIRSVRPTNATHEPYSPLMKVITSPGDSNNSTGINKCLRTPGLRCRIKSMAEIVKPHRRASLPTTPLPEVGAIPHKRNTSTANCISCCAQTISRLLINLYKTHYHSIASWLKFMLVHNHYIIKLIIK